MPYNTAKSDNFNDLEGQPYGPRPGADGTHQTRRPPADDDDDDIHFPHSAATSPKPCGDHLTNMITKKAESIPPCQPSLNGPRHTRLQVLSYSLSFYPILKKIGILFESQGAQDRGYERTMQQAA